MGQTGSVNILSEGGNLEKRDKSKSRQQHIGLLKPRAFFPFLFFFFFVIRLGEESRESNRRFETSNGLPLLPFHQAFHFPVEKVGAKPH
jgi:hypothetical protein